MFLYLLKHGKMISRFISHSFLLLAFWLLSLPWLCAQHVIQGQVKDRNSGFVLFQAVAQLSTPSGEKFKATNEKGLFAFDNLPNGDYHLKISFVGYQSYETQVKVLNEDIKLEILLDESLKTLSEVLVQGFRAPMSGSKLNAKEIRKMNLGQDIPILLNFTPSAVATSDAGSGIGYTSLRIRGSDATRTNVTINGIPLNDSESQGVFWVNTPDFASSVQNVQIQRGVGTSVNGAGAFGATINMETLTPSDLPSAEYNASVGSFNTLKNNVLASSGLLQNKFKLAMRLSQIQSDGFIDMASSNLKSYFATADYHHKNTSVQANVFGGKEVTFQAWYGVPESLLREGQRTYNPVANYHNETDNYQQTHYQLIWNQKVHNQIKTRLALHGTLGEGYYEQFRSNDPLEAYGLEPVRVGDSLINSTELVRQRWLDNQFFGVVFNADYESKIPEGGKAALQLSLGGGYNQYRGRHFGQIVWAKFLSYEDTRKPYYDNDAQKNDFNTFVKANYALSTRLSAFADLQVRHIFYSFWGFNEQLQNVQQSVNLTFFNPKIGLSYQQGQHQAFFSLSRGQKEPNRDEFTQSTPQSRPQSEAMWDAELGWQWGKSTLQLAANLYYMHYQNQLVITGKINDVGAYVRENVPESFRRGVELSARWRIQKIWLLDVNAAFSQNKIQNYLEFIDDYDQGGQQQIAHGQTDISFSPSAVLNGQLSCQPTAWLELGWLSKYVSKQYLDNTSSDSRSLDTFFVNDCRVSLTPSNRYFKNLTISFLVNNVLSHQYESNGYTFGYISGGQTTYENFYFPQAGRNYLLALRLAF